MTGNELIKKLFQMTSEQRKLNLYAVTDDGLAIEISDVKEDFDVACNDQLCPYLRLTGVGSQL